MTTTETPTIFAVGTRVLVLKDGNASAYPATVVSSRGVDRDRPLVKFDDPAQGWRGSYLDDYGISQSVEGLWNVTRNDTVTLADNPAEPVVTATEDVDPLVSMSRDLEAARRAHLRDLMTIGAALAETADRREWCEEYDEAVESLVPQLSEQGQATFREAATVEREREYTVDFNVTYRGSVTVTARNEQAAEELFADDVAAYVDFYSLELDDVDVTEVNAW